MGVAPQFLGPAGLVTAVAAAVTIIRCPGRPAPYLYSSLSLEAFCYACSLFRGGQVVEAILFGLFTMCMMCDQWSVVLTATTQIDRLKGRKEAAGKRVWCQNLTEVFGGPADNIAALADVASTPLYKPLSPSLENVVRKQSHVE